jgi:Bacterial regulatory protein, Fis family
MIGKNFLLFFLWRKSMALKTLKELEREHIGHAIYVLRGNTTQIAHELGIARATLYRKLSSYGLLSATHAARRLRGQMIDVKEPLPHSYDGQFRDPLPRRGRDRHGE